MDIQMLIQKLLQGQAQSPQAQLPSRLDFARSEAPPPVPDTSRTGSTIDFAHAADSAQPPPIPQALLQPDPMPTGGIPTPSPAPQRDVLAQMMPRPRGPMSGRAGEASYTTSGTDPRFAGGSSAIFGRRR